MMRVATASCAAWCDDPREEDEVRRRHRRANAQVSIAAGHPDP
ncbi:hypothetical protein [Kribbella antiqua]|nr:hypothetical protein [Kribbella antiqua]